MLFFQLPTNSSFPSPVGDVGFKSARPDEAIMKNLKRFPSPVGDVGFKSCRWNPLAGKDGIGRLRGGRRMAHYFLAANRSVPSEPLPIQARCGSVHHDEWIYFFYSTKIPEILLDSCFFISCLRKASAGSML